jgi:aerobic-type carbon monoxide dehydrogenase small subunit (CoxS/CutS family)
MMKHSCLLLAAQLERTQVVTIEGLEKNGELDALQQAFLEAGAIQCGYCTPGMIMAAKGLLLHNPTPSSDEIKNAMSGNLCRCTGYKKIMEAVEIAAARQGVNR